VEKKRERNPLEKLNYDFAAMEGSTSTGLEFKEKIKIQFSSQSLSRERMNEMV
jgi:hypothetical protein